MQQPNQSLTFSVSRGLGTKKIVLSVGTKTLGDACGGLRQRIYQLWCGFFE
ncbi:hypothetical protein [Nostoc foliaceum]|uniref:Uncharacterized protein n=2 Tax=Nostoc TaxID=1177 RepID=A0ABR8I2U9_9NOSO|nr:hypothetical protein [Nostoc foliaceum]MBD2559929.1 hypothetical protein [Nostoc linckia FACHB-391]MBD2645107.1 hypothetical protein [Nostoc foliaceum FACHB-393]